MPSKLIDLADIAQNIQTDLNDISATLYANADINKEIQFKVTDNFDYYNRLTLASSTPYIATSLQTDRTYVIVTVGTTDFTLIGADNSNIGTVFVATGPGIGTGTASERTPYTPAILTKADNIIEPDQNISIYNDMYSIAFQGYHAEYADVKYILDTYVLSVAGTYIIQDGWTILRSAENITMIGNINPQDGSGTKRFQAFGDIRWGFIDGGVHSSQVTVKLDNIILPFDDFRWDQSFNHSTTITADNLDQNAKTINLSQSGDINITIPYQTSNGSTVDVINLVKKRIAASVTKIFTFSHTDPLGTDTFDVIVTSVSYGVARGGVATLVIVLKESKLAKE